ncbi:hypothetical protein [Arcobacter porcinus]|uniref:Lipoprotein n=1 Tax=Arcobacter porcinus TaxID=1935204 RepID=A0ABX2YB85_9BACT|nr:hypothetical protein [Arcobacter porcinus]OCL84119.1 hypothetical protein AAW30_00492 [Arcobacter porcinus]OCL84643.1 hypothetical protein AAW29_00321 [Arcobacter porcinus]OCL89183.1 hypothetical protein AAX30_00320 [Arcobacter porcinus]OCL91603.1 hypothetical protein AAX28_01348 [Arcobacter porcinus]
MKKINYIFIVLMIFILNGCSTKIQNIKSTIEKPTNILLNLRNDPGSLEEEWRLEFEKRGFNVFLSDELNKYSLTNKFDNLDISQNNIILDKDINYEIRLIYHYSWDMFWYISKIVISVRDLKAGKIVGSYADDYTFRHPSVSQVMNMLENDFFNKLWR